MSAPLMTGALSSPDRNRSVCDGTADRPLARPSSSASPLVWVSENTGFPVTTRSTAHHATGASATSAAPRSRCGQVHAGAHHSQ